MSKFIKNNINKPVSKNSLTKQDVAQAALKDIKKNGKIRVEEIEDGIFTATSTNSNYIIEYDKNKCIGAASCAAIAMNTFIMNDENKAEIRDDVEEFDEDPTILDAAMSCPVFAIRIIEKETNKVVFPLDNEIM